MQIRRAEQRDLARLRDIYNYEVEHGTATFDIQPWTMEERQGWFDAHNVKNHPLIVAEMEGQVAGYASLSPYRPKEAYDITVELSVYVDPEYRCRGVGTALLEEILQMARQDENTHRVVSVITEGNAASIHLHEQFEFVYCGTLHEVGKKFGRYLDITQYELEV